MLINGTKELAIRDELVEIYTAVNLDWLVFDKSRFIISKQDFEANTTTAGEDRREVRYLQLAFRNFEGIPDAAQFDVECYPMRVNYTLEIFGQHVGTRSDDSNSDDDYVAYILGLHNATISNNELIIDALKRTLTPMAPIEDKTDIKHEIMDVDGYRSKYDISVEVYE